MALNKNQLKQMLDKNGISYDKETTIAQMEKLLMNNSGKIGDDENSNDDQSDENSDDDQNSSDDNSQENSDDDDELQNPPDPDADEKANDDEAKKEEETFESQPPTPVGRDTKTKELDDEAISPVRDITKLYNEDAKNMKAYLAKQPKVKFIIPLAEGEKEGAYETWCGNGHKLTIKKGVMVDLAEQVANDLANHYNINMNAGKESRIDGDTEKEKALN